VGSTYSSGIDIHVAEAGQGPAVLFLHGFPDVWYAWRSQLPALAAAGYHTIAPDLRGCGQSEAPRSIEKYSMRTMTADVVGLLDAMGEHSAVLVAHDMGAHVGWTAAQRFPDRDRFHFVSYVQEPGKAEAELEVDVRRSLRLFVHALSGDAPPELVHHLFMERASTSGCLDGMPEPHRMPNWFTEDDLEYCAREFERTGFAGALNPYRNFDHDWIELAELADVKVHQPALYMAGELDSVTRLGNLDPMRKWVPNLREIVILSACGHWIQQERPEPVSQQLIAFLENLPVEDPSSAS
jgi:pimeloyl-ACP methyl ester carboxylesterase